MSKRRGKFEDYAGKTQYVVEHPAHGKATVFAPDEDSAMVAAADVWNTKWTKADFYLGCKVYKL